MDRSLGGRIVPAAPRAAGHDVVVHDEVFPADTTDATWLTEAGAQHWIVLMKDDRIRYRPQERTALAEAGVRAFALTNANVSGEEQALIFTAHASRIKRSCAEHAGPYIVGVYRDRPFLRPLYPSKLPRRVSRAAKRDR